MAQNIIESRLIPFNLQSGDGVPIHISPAGTLYFDRIFGLTYQNLNGISTWGLLGGGGGGSTFTGGTVTGPTNFLNGLTTTTILTNSISATTYFGLPIDVYVTGGTYNAGTATFTNNTGGTFSVSGFGTGGGSTFTGGTISGETIFTNGLSANTFSATTYLGLPIDVYVTGGTYSAGTAVFTNNTGGTFNVTGFTSGGGGGNSIGELTGDVTAGPATASSQSVVSTVKNNIKTGALGITVDGLGGVISSGQKGYVYVPYDGVITGWSIAGDATGSCVIDVWKDSYNNFPPTSGDSITGTQKPTLTNQQVNRDLNLSSWTTTISSGDYIGFNVEPSPTGVTRVNLIINVIKS